MAAAVTSLKKDAADVLICSRFGAVSVTPIRKNETKNKIHEPNSVRKKSDFTAHAIS